MATCARIVQACALRVARLEPNGVPDPGANNMYVSDALTQLVVDPQVEEGDEFTVKNGCGAICVNVKDCDRLKRLNVTLGLCYPDPELQELLAGGVVLTNVLPGDDAVGYGFPRLNEAACPNGVSVELWAKRYDSSGAPDSTFPYEWYVLPRVYLQHGGRTHENGPLAIEFAGFAIENENWFDGPENDWPVDSDRVYQSIPTASIPTAACGYATIQVS